MENLKTKEELIELIDEKITLAKSLVDKLENDFIEIDGGLKTKRNIDKEMKFLQKLKAGCLKNCDELDVTRKLQCTNLNFFSHLVNSLYNYDDISSISTMRKHNDERSIRIDFICNDNLTWVKIIARNSESIKDEVLGRCEYGSKDILAVADEFLDVASSEMAFFRAPKVVFDFLNPIDDKLEIALEQKGIILGRKFKEFDNVCKEEIKKLNVDITTMLAYVSELSNGGSYFSFNEKLINEQAVMERKAPIKPILDNVFEGKELICCETAVKSFDEIVKLLAGPKEKKRAEEFKNRLKILPDVEHPESIINLELSAQIKDRSRRIFAFGIYHHAITVSSNVGFKRASKMRNFDIPMITHSARALTEKKQIEL
ncbi:CLUMA_CG003822, isoform A [Clunio marinus]|uniref:CLUMA_CG003822, isoform A n=1 Tax=Clunio marinus TaxID=568069 RepID=A0A1J1HPW9_9DIPT|nr:CLUMA_CG003822, isoform A [Clunio marinus]